MIENHDKSKFSANEFQGYRQWFYPEKGQNKNKVLADLAWNHHQKFNPHHWQYWLMWHPEKTIALDMDLKYIIEMLCDWTAMSYKFGVTPELFYNKDKYGMFLSEGTRLTVEYWLPFFTALSVKNRGE